MFSAATTHARVTSRPDDSATQAPCKSKLLIQQVDRKSFAFRYATRSAFLMKNFETEALVPAVQSVSRRPQPKLRTRFRSTRFSNAVFPCLLVGGGLVRARPPPTLLASGCFSASRVSEHVFGSHRARSWNRSAGRFCDANALRIQVFNPAG